jgi:hypothetical protein
MHQEALDKGIESIGIAFSLIEFSYRIQTLGADGMRRLFYDEVEVKGVLIEGKGMDEEDIRRFFLNHLNSAICSFWIAIDEAFDKVLGKKNPKNDSAIDDFRAVIYMFRCAFAHEISEPKWYVKDKTYRRHPYKLSVPPECSCGGVDEFCFDFTSLNGQNVKTEAFKHFRGLATFSQMACELLRSEVQLKSKGFAEL